MQTTTTAQTRGGNAAYALYLGLILLLLIITALGYLGFRQFVTVVMPQWGAFNLLALAVFAGIASFFSPCAFPLLPSYLSFYATAGRGDHQTNRSPRALGVCWVRVQAKRFPSPGPSRANLCAGFGAGWALFW
jgi:hypothetical protein